MSDVLDYLDIFFGFIGALASWFFGACDGVLRMLIAICVIDYCTGVISAYIKKELSSSIGFRGIAKKVTIFILVGVAHVIDRELLGQTALLRDAVIFFYLANEGLSVLENSIVIGIPVPDVLKNKLLQLQEDKSSKNEPEHEREQEKSR